MMIEVVYRGCPKAPILTEDGIAEYTRRNGSIPQLAALIPRDDPVLVSMVKENNPDFIDQCGNVQIAQLPDGSTWRLRGGGRFAEWVGIDG